MRTNRLVALPVLLAVVATTAYWVGAAAAPAGAIPAPQESCSFGLVTTVSDNGVQPIPGASVTLNNGNAARIAIVQFSADTGVDADAEVRISYSVDGGPPQEDVFGPANLANHQEFWEARTVLAVIPLGPGTHTITPHWRVSGASGKNAFMDSRCSTVEARTK